MAQTPLRVLVTGATGFVGRHVVARLKEDGLAVRVLVRPDRARPGPEAEGLEIAEGNVLDAASVAAAARGCRAAVHLVGIIRERPWQTFEAVHATGTAHVVAACLAAGVPRLIYLSALGVGRGTDTAYFRTKEAAEGHVRDSGLDWTILRPAVIHGPRGEFMIQMARMVARPGPVPVVGRGLQVLQPVWVEDVARLVSAALRQEAAIGRTFDVAGPDVLTLRDFYRTLARVLLGREKRLVGVPRAIVRTGAWLAAHLVADPPVTPDQLRMLEASRPCDIRPMVEAFGLEPARFEATLAAYAAELKAAAGLA